MASFSDRLVHVAGGHLPIVDTLTTARRRHELIAYVMAFTAIMATVSMWFFVHDALHGDAVVSTLVALVWGVLIFKLEQVLTNLGMSSAGLGAVGTTIVRLSMAVVIGAIISAPLTLRIFKSDVEFELAQMAAENAGTIKQQIADSPEQAQLDVVDEEIAGWRRAQQGVLEEQSESTAVATLTSDLAAARTDLDEAEDRLAQDAAWVNCERYGTDRQLLEDPSICAPGGGGENGNTSAAEEARDDSQAQVAAAQRLVDEKTQALHDAQRAQRAALRDQVRDLKAAAPAALAELDEQRATAAAALQALKDRLNGTNNGNIGFLAQLDGLDRASAQSPTLNFWKWLIFSAFVILDVLPVVAKLSWLFSREGRRYHEAITMADESALTGLQAQLDADQQVEKDRIDLDRDMRARLNQDAVRQAETVLRDQLQQELDAWKAGVQTGAGVQVNLATATGRQP